MPSITLALSAVLTAPRSRVWSALGDPEQALRWRPGALAVLPPAPSDLAPGRLLRLRCLLGAVPVVLEERTLEVAEDERLQSALRIGLFRCEETFTLAAAGPDGGRTRVSLRITAPNEAALVGESLDRFGVRRFAATLAGGSLAALRHWCEADPAAAPADETLPGLRPRELA